MEISQDLGHRPVVFIRFNPDEYDNIKSCWGINGKGICTIRKSKIGEWKNRLSVLNNIIEYWINPLNITDKTVETIHLFYDTL